jgi:ABC-type Fe3+/spermidine/putrescine transport system ATPase subunit
MQIELKELQKQLGVTTIFVTHDQEEAMTISDRIAVMNAGRIEQIGAPREIYDRPRTRFVADFIGEINVFVGEWRDGVFIANGSRLPAPPGPASGEGTIAVRPERISLADVAHAPLTGRIQTSSFVSGHMNYQVLLDDGRDLFMKEPATSREHTIGEVVGISWAPESAVMLDSN